MVVRSARSRDRKTREPVDSGADCLISSIAARAFSCERAAM